MYRASVPVQRCNLPLHIPLIPLWTVQPVHSISDCTRGHFNFTYTPIPPMDRTVCTEPLPVQQCTLTLPIPLIPVCAVRTVPSFIACTTVQFIITYNSTTPMDRTACTEYQYLYNSAL